METGSADFEDTDGYDTGNSSSVFTLRKCSSGVQEKQFCGSGPLPSLDVCYWLELPTSVQKEKNTMKGVWRGKNNISKLQKPPGAFGAVFDQVFCWF